MTRSSLDPSVLPSHLAGREDQARLEYLRQQLRGVSRAVAEKVFLREVSTMFTSQIPRSLLARFQAESPLNDALRRTLTDDERDGIDAHAADIADTLSRAWVDLWSRTLSDDAKKITETAPAEPALRAVWDEVLAQLGLQFSESVEIFQGFYRAIHEQGAVVPLPNGLVLDGRSSDLWMRRQTSGASDQSMVEEFAVSGQQLRTEESATKSLGEQKRKPG